MKAAQKYAEVGENRPRCKCHGELMVWGAQHYKLTGGAWRCKIKHSQSTMAQHKQKINTLKVEYGGCCGRCGYDKCLSALQFHHRDPAQKLFNVTRCRGSLETMRQEADKCDLICANCHFEEHYPV